MALLARDGKGDDAPRSRGLKCAPAAEIARWAGVLFSGMTEGVIGWVAVGVARHSTDVKHAENTVYSRHEPDLLRMARDSREISPRAEAVYYSLNPVMPAAASRAFTNKDIYSRRWILIDVDPVRPKHASSTDDEKQAAKVTAINVRRWLSQEFRWPKPILADSGNGYHLLYRVDLPNDEASAELVRRVLRAAHVRWSDDAAKVDTALYDAKRVVKAYGTLARKGEDTPERPHRASAMLEVPDDLVVVGVEQLEAVAALATAGEKEAGAVVPKSTTDDHSRNGAPAPAAHTNGHAKRKGLIARAVDLDSREHRLERARAYVDAMPPAVSGSGGHNQTFDAACALVKGFDLAIDEARPILQHYNARCQPPWSDRELEHKLDSADSKPDDRPRGYLWEAERNPGAQASANGKAKKGQAITIPSPEGVPEHADDPYRLARGYLQARHGHDDRATLLWWNEEWWSWSRTGNHWHTVGERELTASVAGWVKAEFDRLAREHGVMPKPIGTRAVGNVMLALRALATVPLGLVPELPAWLDPRDDDPDPRHCLVTRSGIVHLPSLVAGRPDAVRTATPRYFTPNALSYAFDPEPPEPTAWLGFLDDVWGDDPDSIAALQEWFGYLLTSDTSRQKILMVLGPRRSGKGTITRTLRALVGEANVAAPTLSSMAGPFGLQPLIGKTVCLCPESRLTGRSDTQAIVERLLSISGEDPQTLDRKRIESWSGVLRTRFVLMGNEFPRLSDYSDAILGRLVLLKLTRSFYGQEDPNLGEKIAAELPGILVWAIAGWARLQGQRQFTQPESGRQDLDEAHELVNPVGAFVAQRCAVGRDETCPVDDLYEAWKAWCNENGREHPGDKAGFGRNLRTAVPKVDVRRPKKGGSRVRFFVGISLRPDEGEF